MGITLGTNIASVRAQRQLIQTGETLGTVFERLSSGQRINRASDDAAGLAISESLRTDRRVYNQAIRNFNDGLSLLNIADGAVAELSNIIIRIQELAEQSANGSFSNIQRESLDIEAQELSAEFFRISRSTDFNDLQLFDGSLANGVRLQGGYGLNGGISSSLGGVMGDGTFSLQNGTISVGASPDAADIGDVNGDGIADVVTANLTSNDISLLIGNGDGTFQSSITFASGASPRSIILGDVDGDGALDIVAANASGASVSVFIGDGTGNFQDAVTYTTGVFPEVTLADLDNDGNLDIITANETSDDLSVLYGRGDGTFDSQVTLADGPDSAAVAIGDLNGDGILDIVGLSRQNDQAIISYGIGDRNFQAYQQVTVGDSPGTIRLEDLNNDGSLDVVTANLNSNDVTVRLGNGDGTFRGISTFDAGTQASEVHVADFDSDGVLDLVVANTGSDDLSVFIGNGDGSFAAQQTITTGGLNPNLNVGDLNGDGVYDLFVVNSGSGRVMLGDTREGIAPLLEFSLKTQADALQAMAPMERKLNSLSEQRGVIGAFQSRLQSALNTLAATSENYAAAESRIRDSDIADESAQLVRNNILQQAAAAVLSQANQQPALSLQLLG